ncbi:enoyl-CoA hydratase [Lacisediminimonas profundi]|uniref:enoyl-CoA hydratase n=1 Tax=Lacisediminimonas profundi TaxID=2603856 RepID=UPI00124B8020|nr:enoyl-CoA hydratase [Lacisediminimonas profundi]
MDTRQPADDLVLRSDSQGVVTLKLNRGERFNPLSSEMIAALQREFDRLMSDQSARVVVLAAEGRAFSAGHDLREMRANPDQDYYRKLFDQCSKIMLTMQKLPQPVIARVHGMATAAGCQLVATCDLAIASDDARFAVSGVNLGLFCSTPAVALSRNVHRKQAMEMLLTGDFIDAETAMRFGLVNRVVPSALLDAEIASLASGICAKPMVSVKMGKQLFYRQLEMGTAAAYQLAAQTMACNMMDASALEGVQAFLEKRTPDWPGRT